MKKYQREIYQILANEVDFILCSFCRFGLSTSSVCDGDGDIECHHSLNGKCYEFDKQEESAMNMGDCWGFRPSHDISFCADIIGIILEKGWDSVGWWEEDGNWKVVGSEVGV